MLYIMITPEGDNVRKNARGDIFIGGELYTVREWERIRAEYHRDPEQLRGITRPVDVSKKRVYWFFGARFSAKTGGYMCRLKGGDNA